MNFINEKYLLHFLDMIDRYDPDLADKTIIIQNVPFHQLKKNYQNCYVTEKRIVSKLSKKFIQNLKNAFWRPERFCEDFTSLSHELSEKFLNKQSKQSIFK